MSRSRRTRLPVRLDASNKFEVMSGYQHDGWGVAVTSPSSVGTRRSVTAIKSSPELSRLLERIEIGPELMSTYGPLRRLLNRQYMLGRDTPDTDPRTDRPLRSEPECTRERLLTTQSGGGFLDRVLGHIAESSAETARSVNANTAKARPQTQEMSRADTRKSFWLRLVEAWGARGLPTSQMGVARELGMSQGSVGRWGRDEGLPELDTVRGLALKGDVCVEWLISGRGPKRPMPVDEETNDLLELWRQLQENGRHAVRVAAQGALALQREGRHPPRPAREPQSETEEEEED